MLAGSQFTTGRIERAKKDGHSGALYGQHICLYYNEFLVNTITSEIKQCQEA